MDLPSKIEMEPRGYLPKKSLRPECVKLLEPAFLVSMNRYVMVGVPHSTMKVYIDCNEQVRITEHDTVLGLGEYALYQTQQEAESAKAWLILDTQ